MDICLNLSLSLSLSAIVPHNWTSLILQSSQSSYGLGSRWRMSMHQLPVLKQGFVSHVMLLNAKLLKEQR